ncbi:3-methyl-2-oxobutanoate dehydrogenase subunit VorB [Clostridia bacterium]|nr:3-methyl-2-oxobutanoate dehydrogenase subunit VorB [Clostridia bacterium]
MEKKLLKGNEAFAEAAIRAGCRFYFGYPITPQNEIAEYMSWRLPEAGGGFVQAESELAAVNMAYGASAAGGRTLISSSSPGIALMQEGLSFLCSVELPLVIINASRGGPGIGSIQPGQADYFQATRGGGNGDYHLIVFAPSSIQEAIDMLQFGFDAADRYRNPVMFLIDGMLGQMMEPVTLPPMRDIFGKDAAVGKPWALTGHGDKREHNVVKSLHLNAETLEGMIEGYWGKYREIEETLTDWESVDLKDAELIFVAYGSTARVVKEAMEILRGEDIRTGLIRPKTLWPFPRKAFDAIGPGTRKLMSVELSMGQLIQDVELSARGRWPVGLVHRVGGILITPQQVVREAKEFLEDKIHGNGI